RAVLASGITAIAGFGGLIFSNSTMLRDVGCVTLIDLSVSLAGVLLLLPAVLALSERDGLLAAARGSVRRAIAAVPRPGRRARVA
ncbi:MAG: MMPL family transporter, partial [Solirubrobacteraceae bacterium]